MGVRGTRRGRWVRKIEGCYSEEEGERWTERKREVEARVGVEKGKEKEEREREREW